MENTNDVERQACSPSGASAGSAFGEYMHAKDRREAAYQRYNAASHWLELETIKQRLAEIKSQHEPLASLLSKPLGERERLYAAAYYVVVGRMPNH